MLEHKYFLRLTDSNITTERLCNKLIQNVLLTILLVHANIKDIFHLLEFFMDTINLEQLTPTRPYMVKAIFNWLEDNQLTPYIMVDTSKPHVIVPSQFIQDNRIVLSIASRSTHQFSMDHEFVHFHGRFGGVSQEIWVPFYAILGIYAKENTSLGMFFDPAEYQGKEDIAPKTEKTAPTKVERPRRANTAGLKVLK